MFTIQSLYTLSIQALVESDLLYSSSLKCLSGLIKDDILNLALVRGKTKVKLQNFLHNDTKILQTRGTLRITEEDLIDISKCDQIRVLEMNPPTLARFNHPSNLLDEMMSKLKCLVKLHLQRNDGVTDDVIKTLVSQTRSLQELDVSGCHKLTDSAAEALAGCSTLQVLSMCETQVSDKGLICLAEGKCALSLREICMNNCVNIQGSGFFNVVECCQSMQIISFSGCSRVTGSGEPSGQLSTICVSGSSGPRIVYSWYEKRP